jgi:hypothetical protein
MNQSARFWLRAAFDKVSSGQPRARNGWGTLYQRSTGRRLAESRALPVVFGALSLTGPGKFSLDQSSQAQEVASHEKLIRNSTFHAACAGFLLTISDSRSTDAVSFSSARTTKRFPSPRYASTIQIVRPVALSICITRMNFPHGVILRDSAS